MFKNLPGKRLSRNSLIRKGKVVPGKMYLAGSIDLVCLAVLVKLDKNFEKTIIAYKTRQ